MSKSKKYIRVSQHVRHLDNLRVIVPAHIRKNPKYKEVKMSNDQDTGSNVKQEQPRDLTAKREAKRDNVNVSIRHVDGHYLVSFNHGPTRIFHNTEELLVAIEVEANRLRDG